MNRMAATLIVASLACASGAAAETAFELAFRPGTLDHFDVGDRLEYASAVTLPADGESGLSTVSVEIENGGLAALGEQDDGAEQIRFLGEFDAEVGNPLVMYFFERTVRGVSQQTGGGAFYLRNRIKDALRQPEDVRDVQVDWHGRSVGATEIVLAPFEDDPNLARLGVFGDMRIRLVVGEDVPGWYHSLTAEAGEGAFASTVSLAEVVQ